VTEASARLDGRRVAVTRGKGGEDPLTVRLRELGAQVLEVPAIAIAAPESWDAFDAVLRDLEQYDWIAFASATAVDATLARIVALGLPPPPVGTRLAAVGKATAQRLQERLRAPDLVPESATGAAMAEAMAPLVRGRRVLVPRAAEGRHELMDGLAAAGADVVDAPCYRTVAAPAAALVPLGEAILDGKIDAVTFASPSAVRSVVVALGGRAALLDRCALAAIGPTTAAALQEAGLRVSVTPAISTAAGLADALARHLGPKGQGAP
jgi:uroporphyrinogen-III synthase/uroporphyrinogen III methyltransferase/synthase